MKSAAIRFAVLTALSLQRAMPLRGTPVIPPPTYAEQISRIIQKHCEACHRSGSVGPFPLTNYDEVSAFASEIRRSTQSRKMPPWFGVPGYGEFQNQLLLSVEEIKTLGNWFDAGVPLGNLKDLPPKTEWKAKWAYGQPDVVLTPAKPYTVVGSVGDEVRCFVVPSGLKESKAIRAMDVRPGAPGMVYHVRAFADITGAARRLDARNLEAGFDCSLNMESVLTQKLLGEWEAGYTFSPLPEGVGRYLPKSADVVLEIHYHRTYKSASDQTKVALYFQHQMVHGYMQTATIVNRALRVPPGRSDYRAAAEWVSERDILAFGVTPHMHRLGTAVKITAFTPGGAVRNLAWVNRYNFRWQTSYVFKEPISIPKGTTVRVEAYYDNSNQNMNLNPHEPLHESGWGNSMEDEMLVVFLDYIDVKRP